MKKNPEIGEKTPANQKQGPSPLPLVFRHGDLFSHLEENRELDRNGIVNILNYAHFTGRPVYLHLRHPRYDAGVLVPAQTEPCSEEPFCCRWVTNGNGHRLDAYSFHSLLILDEPGVVFIPAESLQRGCETWIFALPEKGYVINLRQTRRHAVRHAETEIMQCGFLARGELLDFSTQAFHVRVRPESSSSFAWFNPDAPMNLRFTGDGRVVFAGECRLLRQTLDPLEREMVLAPTHDTVQRFAPEPIRNPRRQVSPPLMALFHHPLLGKRKKLEIYDISTSGISVREPANEGMLFPGLILPDVDIHYAGTFQIRCSVQTIYRRQTDHAAHCGLAVLDMDIHSYSRLNYLLGRSMDPHTFISTEVDMDALWEFFFDTGFLYAKKYRLLQSYKDRFKETYRKLYQENPDIARHITYEKDGRIYGHMSMVKAYERAWMIHHHAARNLENRLPGFQVLKQIMIFLNGMCHLPSARMDYVMCYYRPDNKFPERVFGGFASHLNNPRGCSLDLFAYLTWPVVSGVQLPAGWTLADTTPEDLRELRLFYAQASGGLLPDVLDLEGIQEGQSTLEQAYARLGFLRRWKSLALWCNGKLAAVLIPNRSDLGINLSELLNGVTILLLEPALLSQEILSAAVSGISGEYNLDKVPLLIYPHTGIGALGLKHEKLYSLWVMDTRFANNLMEFVQRKFRMKYE